MKKLIVLILALALVVPLSGCRSAARRKANLEKRARNIEVQERQRKEEERKIVEEKQRIIEESKPKNREIGFSCISCKRRWILRAYELEKECPGPFPKPKNCKVKCPYCGKIQDARMANSRFLYDTEKERKERLESLAPYMLKLNRPSLDCDTTCDNNGRCRTNCN